MSWFANGDKYTGFTVNKETEIDIIDVFSQQKFIPKHVIVRSKVTNTADFKYSFAAGKGYDTLEPGQSITMDNIDIPQSFDSKLRVIMGSATDVIRVVAW